MTEAIDHRAFVASLTPEQRDALTRRFDGPGLVRLTVHLSALAILGWLIAERAAFWPILVVAQAFVLIFLFSLLHETIHLTAFRTRWINEVVARFCGFAVVLPPDWFRYFHYAHHRHTHIPGKDPELSIPKPENLGQLLVYVSGLPTHWSHGKTTVRNALGLCDDAFVPTSGRARVQREARGMLIGYAGAVLGSIAIGSDALVWVWLVPLLIGQPFLRLYLLAEHGECPNVPNMFENTRTTYTNWLMRLLAWNMPYHVEHHVYPSVPFHRLPDFHLLTRPHLRVTERGYVRFHRKYFARLAGIERPSTIPAA